MPKNNDRFWRILRVALFIGGILVTIALAYGALNQKVETNSEQVKVHTEKIEVQEKALIEIQTDIKYIKKGIEEIKEKLE